MTVELRKWAVHKPDPRVKAVPIIYFTEQTTILTPANKLANVHSRNVKLT